MKVQGLNNTNPNQEKSSPKCNHQSSVPEKVSIFTEEVSEKQNSQAAIGLATGSTTLLFAGAISHFAPIALKDIVTKPAAVTFLKNLSGASKAMAGIGALGIIASFIINCYAQDNKRTMKTETVREPVFPEAKEPPTFNITVKDV